MKHRRIDLPVQSEVVFLHYCPKDNHVPLVQMLGVPNGPGRFWKAHVLGLRRGPVDWFVACPACGLEVHKPLLDTAKQGAVE